MSTNWENALSAIQNGNLAELKKIFPNLNQIEKKDLLLSSAEEGKLEILKYLIFKLKCDPNQKNNDGRDCLSLASEHGNLNVVEFLISNGSKIDSIDNEGCTPLVFASQNGNLEIVKFLISKGLNPNSSDNNGWTPLMDASFHDRLEIVKYLISELKCDPNQKNNDGQDCLSLASGKGHLSVVEFLISNGSKIDSIDNEGWTALHWASGSHENVEIVKFLISQGFKLNAVAKNGWTPLMAASRNGKLEIVKYFVLELKCDPNQKNNDGRDCLSLAASKHRNLSVSVVEFLISNGSKIDSIDNNGWTPLHWASGSHENVEIVKFLISQGSNPNSVDKTGWTPLMAASHNGKLEIVKYFVLELKCDPNQKNNDGQDCLSLAVSEHGNLSVVEFLISNGSKIDSIDNEGWTALHWASARLENIEIVKFLILKGSNPNSVDKYGRTPLMISSRNGKLEITKYFVFGLKCDPNQKNNDGQDCLSLAVSEHRNLSVSVVEFLISNGSKIDSIDNNGWTPLHWASRCQENVEIVKFLLSKGFKLNAVAKNGWTPLMAASHNGKLEIVKYFVLELKCDPNQKNNDGRDCLSLAVSEHGNLSVVEFLISNGSKIESIDNNGWTALHWASGSHENVGIVKFLISHGFKLNAVDENGWTPLMAASRNGKLEITKYFVSEMNCDPNQTDNDFQTCLHLAAIRGHMKTVEYLFSIGCNPNSLDKNKKMAIDLASEEGHKSIVEYLTKIPQQYYNEMRMACLATNQELANQIQKLNQELKQTQSQHKQEIQKQMERHSTELKKQSEIHVGELRNERQAHAQELGKERQAHAQELGKHVIAEREKSNQQINKLTKEIEERLQNARNERESDLSKQKSELESKHSLELKLFKLEIEKLRKELADSERKKSFQYQKQIEDLEQQLKTESSKQQSTTQNIHTLDCKKDLVFGITLGSGSFGKVLKSKMGIQDVAVKTIKLEDEIDPNEFPKIKESFEKELEILNRARHPNIVNVVGVCRNIDHLSFILELAERGSLYRYLHQTKGFKFSEEQTIRILIDISNGMNYLHQFKPQIIHRDLKSDNILLFSDWTAKVTDFGLSKLKEASSRSKTDRNGMVGTVNWMAPEMMDPNLPKTTDRVDVYSFGMVIFEMLSWDEEHQTHLKPWNGMNSALIATSVREGRRPADPVPKNADPKKKDKVSGDLIFKSLLSLMKKCWIQNARERPSFSIVVSELEKLENGVKVFVDWKLSPDLLLIEGWKSPPKISTSRTLTIKPLPAPTTPNNNRNVLNVIQNSIVLENEKLTSLLEKLHNTKSFKIEQAHVIDNSALQISFESRIDSLNRKILENPSLFGPKPVSPHSSNDQFRQKILNRLDLYAEQWLHNQNKGNLQLIPMFHALQDEKSGWSIAGTGFSNLQRIDKGYFGSGIYFTSNLEYACKYVKEPIQLEGGKNGYWVMLSWVLIGNALPVVEYPHFKGKPIEPGYDAHWTIVKHEKGKSYIPISSSEHKLMEENLTELVVNQESQCLPMYLLFVVNK